MTDLFAGMDPTQPRDRFANTQELIIDSFAGGGGASLGIELALGRSPDYAINHDEKALAMHRANHPDTVHLSKNIYQVDPLDVVGHQPVGLLWSSPDCKHFSKAKGGKPVSKNIRDLATIVPHWAKRVRPRRIILENVEEFRQWGPLTREGRPCKDRMGQEFDRWVKELERYGYRVEWQEMRGCDFGAPTIRKRLIVIARCDSLPIVWPRPTHMPTAKLLRDGYGDPADPDYRPIRLPYNTAASIIDWSLPCPSIFDTAEEIYAKYGVRAKRPLAPATMARIARGVQRYVLDAAHPFLVICNHSGVHFRGQGLDEPMSTVTAARDAFGLVTPFLSYGQQGGGIRSIEDPHHTVTASKKDTNAIVAAFLAQHNAGPRPGMQAKPLDEPISTITASGSQQGVVAAHIQNMRGSDRRDASLDAPLNTISAGGQHAALVAAFMDSYFGTDQAPDLREPMPTDTTRDRRSLVKVNIDGQTYVITDIGLRMLTPRERFRAQGFPNSYQIDTGVLDDGSTIKLTQEVQGRCCGNSVCPPLAAALVAANCADLAISREAAE